MNFTLKIWRQENSKAKGRFKTYKIENISPDCSFLEMLDILNEKLIHDKIELPVDPVAFDHDCREGICGMCSLISMDILMDLNRALQFVRFTCGNSRMETPS